MPRAAPAGAYPAARLIFFYRRDVDRMKEDLQKADRVQVFVGGMIGLMEISASMETTRIRPHRLIVADSAAFLSGRRNSR